MNILSAIRRIFPPPRRPVRVADALPAALFAAAFAATLLVLVVGGTLAFSSPWVFLLGGVAPWVWWMSLSGASGLSGARRQVALLVRLALIGLFLIALAEPRAVRKSDGLSVIYAVDLSDSIGSEAQEKAMTFVAETLKGKPQRDRAGLVVFGGSSAVEVPPRYSWPNDFGAINSRVARDATNIEKGLALAVAMLPEEDDGRIVLISDGTETEGQYAAALNQVVAREAPVDVLPIEYSHPEEVWLEKLNLPKQVKAGETYDATVILSSLQPGRGRLTLRENGRLIYDQDQSYAQGKNAYTLPLRLREPGFYTYEARIEPPVGHDGIAENNVAINHLLLRGEGKILVVADSHGDERDWTQLLASMRRAKREAEVIDPLDLPADPLSLTPYDCIVFVNVAADQFSPMQQQAVRDAVFSQGIGFVMVGGPNSFGPGGYNHTPIEETLPVSMDVTSKKVLPKGALAIILHTCEFADGNTWAKRITIEAMRVLSAQDEVGVLAYTGTGEGWIFPLTPVSEYEKLVVKINAAQPGDMPSFAPTMQMGLTALRASDAAQKHMIIISDGDPSPPSQQTLQAFRDAGIKVSTIAINPHSPTEQKTLRSIANVTDGTYYFAQNPNQLPSIFIKEAKTLQRSMIQNKVFTPTASGCFPTPVLKGFDYFKPLKGYVITTPKPLSQIGLKVPIKDQTDPVLAVWQFGLGKSAAWTSDLSPNWGAAWVDWEKYDAFVKQLMIEVSRVEKPSNLLLTADAEGGAGMLSVDDFDPNPAMLEVNATVRGPNDRTETFVLRQVAPGRYQAEFPLWGKGRYQALALGQGDGRSERIMASFVVPYSPEYLRFRSNSPALVEIAQRTGGRVLTGAEKGPDIYPAKRKVRRATRPIVDWFLIALAVLLPLDVGVRRVQLDWQVIRGWFVRRKGVSDQTLGALLKRKQEITFARPEKESRPLKAPAAPSTYRPVATPTTAPQPPVIPAKAGTKGAPQKPEDTSTTGRLLAAKKRWKQGDPKEGEKPS